MDEKEKNIVIKAMDACAELDSMIGQPCSAKDLYKLVDDIKPALDRMMPKMICVDTLKRDVKIGCAIFKKGTTVIAMPDLRNLGEKVRQILWGVRAGFGTG